MRRTAALVLSAGLLSTLSINTVAEAGGGRGHPHGDLAVSAARAPVAPDGDVAGAVTDIVVTFRDTDPSVSGIGLKAGGTVSIRLDDEFVNTGSLPVESTGSSPGCAPPVVSTCSTAVLLQGWPQSPSLPFPSTTWDAETNTVTLTANADWMPAGTSAPGAKQAHLMLFGFVNPDRPGSYPLSVEIRPDPASDEVLGGAGRVLISPRVRASVNPNSQANGGPPPPFPNSLHQSVAAGDVSLNMAVYLWDRDAGPVVGADFAPGSARQRPLLVDGHPVGSVHVRPPKGAADWSLVSAGPSTQINAFVTGLPTGRLVAALQTDPDTSGTYVVTFHMLGGNSLEHHITAS